MLVSASFLGRYYQRINFFAGQVLPGSQFSIGQSPLTTITTLSRFRWLVYGHYIVRIMHGR